MGFKWGFLGGVATGATNVIKADLKANEKKVSEMAQFAAQRAIKKRDAYEAELKEFEKGANELAGILGGKKHRGMDSAQFLLSEYGSVEAAKIAATKLATNAKVLGTSVYEQLKLSGALENRISPTGRQLALTYVPRPIKDKPIEIKNSGWASILQGEDSSSRVEREKREYLTAAGLGEMPQLKGEVAPVLEGIPSSSIRQVPKDTKEALDRSNIRLVNLQNKLRELEKDPATNKKQIESVRELIDNETRTVKDIKDVTLLSQEPDLNKLFDRVTVKLFPYLTDIENNVPVNEKEYNALLTEQQNIAKAMSMKARARSTTRTPGSSIGLRNAMAWVDNAKKKWFQSIGWKSNMSAAEFLPTLQVSIREGLLDLKELPDVLQGIATGGKVEPSDVIEWRKMNMSRIELATYQAAKRIGLQPDAEGWFLDQLKGVRELTDVGSPTNMAIETLPKGSLTDIFETLPESEGSTENKKPTYLTDSVLTDSVARTTDAILNNPGMKGLMNILRNKGSKLQGQDRQDVIRAIAENTGVPIRIASEAFDNVLAIVAKPEDKSAPVNTSSSNNFWRNRIEKSKQVGKGNR